MTFRPVTSAVPRRPGSLRRRLFLGFVGVAVVTAGVTALDILCARRLGALPRPR